MKKSNCQSMLHIYLFFLLPLLGAVLMAVIVFFLMITVRSPDGRPVRSSWPIEFTEAFGKQIVSSGSGPWITQAGLKQLEDDGIGVQILDSTGQELFSYQKPGQAGDSYSGAALLSICQTGHLEGSGMTVLAGTVPCGGDDRGEATCIYLLHFPMEISRITLYLNGGRFSTGKAVILPVAFVLFAALLISGTVYGIRTARTVGHLAESIADITARRYLPEQRAGTFEQLYESLNTLDAEIRESDRIQEQTDRMQKEWIANITHDLKTPLSPIKGYAEILRDASPGQCTRYAHIISRNAVYMETLIDDLKLVCQLEHRMLPLNLQETDVIRFLKEIAIDILNTPEYENRVIRFDCLHDSLPYSLDRTLMTRALRNLIINAFVHGREDTQVILNASLCPGLLEITVADNGTGMTSDELDHLFDRYYRGTGTRAKTEGTGLGLTIAQSIITLHGGTVRAASTPGAGTVFRIHLPSS